MEAMGGEGKKIRKHHDDEEHTAARLRGWILKRARDDISGDYVASSNRPKRGVDYSYIQGTSVTNNGATTGPGKASESPPVVPHRRSARIAALRDSRTVPIAPP
jgi:hypothetical protein